MRGRVKGQSAAARRRSRSGPYAARRRTLLVAVLAAGLLVLGRSVDLQVVEGPHWLDRAQQQQSQRLVLPAPRGTVYDRNGVPLASSREGFRVAVAPHEVEEREQAHERLRQVLGLSAAEARRVLSTRRRWVPLSGEHDAVVKDALGGMSGFYFERVQRRHYPYGELAAAVLGRVDATGAGATGLELSLDSLLAGRSGAAVVRRDARGRPLPGAMLVAREPQPGQDVYLTLDHQLQEIAHDALRDALERTGAQGGDMLIGDPVTGEVLAAATVRTEGNTWTGAIEPYEPGSTLKPFLVSALLSEERVTPADSVFAEEGHYVAGGRTIRDVHPYGWLTVADALRVSSNVAMAKLAARLRPAEQYRYLRDFGFGTLTGVSYPSESMGLLRRPDDWSAYSSASLAMGYEVSVTPLQMMLAYAALANGGILMEPRLVREVRGRDGALVRSFGPRPVRRVIPAAVAERVRGMLIDVVEDGTAQQASMSAFRLAGKTGTARVYSAGSYQQGAYTASFAGFFPADDPQLVILVKLDRPEGSYYGGSTAAPVTRATLEAALAARGIPLDARSRRDSNDDGRVAPPLDAPAPAPLSPSPLRRVLAPRTGPARPPAAGPFVLVLDQAGAESALVSVARRTVPDVLGLPIRDAAALLHRHGLRVQVRGHGAVLEATPAAGSAVPASSVVTLHGTAAPRTDRSGGVILAGNVQRGAP